MTPKAVEWCRTIVKRWMICCTFLHFQIVLFFYEANRNLINSSITNTSINCKDINKCLQIIDILYELVLLDINHQFIDHHWLILLDRLWAYSPLMTTNGAYIYNHNIHDITFNPPNTSWILGIVSNQGVAEMHVIYVCIFVTNGFLLILNCSWDIKAFLIS